MGNKSIDTVNEIEKVANDWLKKVREINKYVPKVESVKEEAEWTKNILNSTPSNIANELNSGTVNQAYSQSLISLKGEIPLIDLKSGTHGFITSGTSTTASDVVFSQIVNYSESPDPQLVSWAKPHISFYQQIQNKHNRALAVKDLMARLDSSLPEYYQDVIDSYNKTKAGITYPSECATHMRNLLYKLQGELLTRAGNTKDLSKGKRWSFIAEKLTTGIDSIEHKALITQENFYQDLISELSQIVKNRQGNQQEKLEVTHTKFIDFLFSVLNLINI